eukprot:15296386-Alexandrium_andersonii.AAC.1
MSASLVGSEMCIRDRATSGECSSRRGSQLLRALLARQPAVARTCGVATVSYTHLTLPTICSV